METRTDGGLFAAVGAVLTTCAVALVALAMVYAGGGFS